MKKRVTVVMSLVFALMFCTSALAGTMSATGTSTHGATCVASMVYGSTWGRAGTDADEYGYVYARATVHFKTSTGTDSVEKHLSRNGYEIDSPTVEADAGCPVTKVVTTHIYTSQTFGNWSKTLTKNY